jgi:hypothetical protein
MDPLTVLRQAVKTLLSDIAEQERGGFVNADTQTFVVFDNEHDQYLVVRVGWQGAKRINGIVIHCRIVDGYIWIEENWTERHVRSELVSLGVPEERIILGFVPAILREAAEPAVA